MDVVIHWSTFKHRTLRMLRFSFQEACFIQENLTTGMAWIAKGGPCHMVSGRNHELFYVALYISFPDG